MLIGGEESMKTWLLMLAIVFSAFVMPFTNVTSAAYENSKSTNQESVFPLSKAHAHNDYWHTRPLLDALEHGFTSVEADIWLVDGELLVGHDKEELRHESTLKSLYLDPLRERIKRHHGSVYPGYKHDFLLWIDIKSEGEATYRVLHEQLRNYQKMLTKFTHSGVKPGAVTVIISGNRPRTLMENQRIRYAAYDGRMTDLGTGASKEFMPVISDNWQKHFTWMGKGEMPKEEREKLKTIVSTAHANGQIVRFWATPDSTSPEREAIWRELLNAGVDLINTDDLAGLQQYFMEHGKQLSDPHFDWKTKGKQ
jgi:Glycerophosphoryl diester phosphodiesterase family